MDDGWSPDDSAVHHVPRECWHCGAATESRTGEYGTLTRVIYTDYWWCPQCAMAMVCLCRGCVLLRVLANM